MDRLRRLCLDLHRSTKWSDNILRVEMFPSGDFSLENVSNIAKPGQELLVDFTIAQMLLVRRVHNRATIRFIGSELWAVTLKDWPKNIPWSEFMTLWKYRGPLERWSR